MSEHDIPAGLGQKFAKIDEEIAWHQAAIAKLGRDKTAIAKNTLMTCGFCKKQAPLGRFDFIQEHWYERPHSCNEGDSWSSSRIELCHIVCPWCRAQNFVYTHEKREKILFLLVTHELDPEAIFAVTWDRFGRDATPEKRADRRERERALQGR